jgi:GntR family transcriptional regulator
MFLSVDPNSGLPVYRQIMDQVRRMIVAGRLAPGDRLPSVRDLAATLQINPLTVGKAYTELERDGAVEMRRGLGVFVREPRSNGRRDESRVPPGVEQAAERYVLEAAQAGLSRSRAAEVVERAWRDLVSESIKTARRQ